MGLFFIEVYFLFKIFLTAISVINEIKIIAGTAHIEIVRSLPGAVSPASPNLKYKIISKAIRSKVAISAIK